MVDELDSYRPRGFPRFAVLGFDERERRVLKGTANTWNQDPAA
jgi:hypothetical protein